LFVPSNAANDALTKVLFNHEQVVVFAPKKTNTRLHCQLMTVMAALSVGESNPMFTYPPERLNRQLLSWGAGSGEADDSNAK
jgi:hypothetical protein